MKPRLSAVIGLVVTIQCAARATAQVNVPEPQGTVSPAVVRDNAAPQTGTGGIRGRVVDAETGAALHDTQLRLTGGGVREGFAVGTDDDGRYEFENLPVGRYTLTALKPGYMTLAYGQRRPFESGRPIDVVDKQTLESIDFAVPRGGVIAARVTDENGEPMSDVVVHAHRFRFSGTQRTLVQVAPSRQVTDDRGEVRVFGLPPGDYYVSATAPPPRAGQNGASYVQTFFPDTANIDLAQRVVVQVGREVNVNIALSTARLARVSGVVRGADGSAPPGLTLVTLASRGPVLVRGAATLQGDGTFTIIPGVPPGEYSLQALLVHPTDRLQGRASVTVTGTDVTDLIIPIMKGGTIRGRVLFEGDRPSNSQITSMRPNVMSSVTFVGGQIVQTDGTFVLASVFDPGLVRVLELPAGWFLKAVRLGGKDITDVPLGVDEGAELTGVEILLTQTHAEISGTATDAAGATISDYAVVVFPEDRSRWTVNSRFIATARPDHQGRFRVSGLPSGRYLATAVDYIEPGSERDPELLDRLRAGATAVSVDDGEAKTVTLLIVQ